MSRVDSASRSSRWAVKAQKCMSLLQNVYDLSSRLESDRERLIRGPGDALTAL